MWRKVRPYLLKARLDPVRVENPIHPGTPDVNLADGRWVELKCIPRWPRRASTVVRIDHFTPQQRVWLFRRWHFAPGSTLLLLEVQSEKQWLLFDGDVAARVVGRVPVVELQQKARAIFAEKELTVLVAAFPVCRAPAVPSVGADGSAATDGTAAGDTGKGTPT